MENTIASFVRELADEIGERELRPRAFAEEDDPDRMPTEALWTRERTGWRRRVRELPRFVEVDDRHQRDQRERETDQPSVERPRRHDGRAIDRLEQQTNDPTRQPEQREQDDSLGDPLAQYRIVYPVYGFAATA